MIFEQQDGVSNISGTRIDAISHQQDDSRRYMLHSSTYAGAGTITCPKGHPDTFHEHLLARKLDCVMEMTSDNSTDFGKYVIHHNIG